MKTKELASDRTSLVGWLQALLAYSPVPGIRVESAVYALSHLQVADSTQDLWKMLTLQRVGRGAYPFAQWPHAGISDLSDPALAPAVTPRSPGEPSLLSDVDKTDTPVDGRQEELERSRR
jgi:hypothetical protein